MTAVAGPGEPQRRRPLPGRPPSHPFRLAAGPVLLAACSGLALWRAFVPADLALGVGAGVVAGTLAGWFAARLPGGASHGPIGGPIGGAAGVVIAVAALAAGLVVVTGEVQSPANVPAHFATFLGIGLPADGLDDLAVVPFVVTSVTVALAVRAALRSRPLTALLVGGAGLVGAALLAGPVGVPPAVAGVFCVVLTGSLLATARPGHSELERLAAPSTTIRRTVPWWRPAMLAVPAAALAAAALAIPTPPTFDVRRYVESDLVVAADENPLAVAARLVADPPRGAAEPDVRVGVDGPSPGRMRLAVLDDYAPEGWHQLAEYSVTGTHLAGSAVADSRRELSRTTTRVEISDLDGRSGLLAIPTAGTPLEVVDATGLRYAPDAGLLLPVGDGPPGDVTYLAAPDEPRPGGAGGRSPSGVGRAVATCPRSDLIRGIAQQLVADVDDPLRRLAVIERWLKSERVYVADASGGQTLASVERFLGQGFAVGNLEVFVSAYALLARCGGVPVRVVVGYPAPPGDVVTEFAAADITAWVETPIAGVGWVAVDPVPTPVEQERIREQIAERPPPDPDEAPPAVTTTTVPVQEARSPASRDWRRPVLLTLAGALAMAAVAVAWSVAIRRRTIARRSRVADPALAALLAWTTLLERFHDNRQSIGAHLTASEAARSTAGRVPAPVTRMMGELAAVVDRARFDGDRATADDAGLAWALADASLARLPAGWLVWSAPLRSARRARARLRLTRRVPLRRRRWIGEVPASAAVLDPDGRPAIDGFDVVARVGVGSTAVVYRATQATSGRTVAIKVFSVDPAGGGVDRQRFVWEARVAETVSGRPHLPDVLGWGFTADGLPYVVTKFYERGTLARRIRIGGPLAAPQVTAMARQLARALHTLHESGVLHGDVRPENVFVDDDESIVLGDLGAGWRRAAGGPATTLTPVYAAPEVWLGHAPTVRSDIYSLGLTLLFAATGVPPSPGTTPSADDVIAAFGSDVAVPLLEIDPRRRPRTAADVAERFGAETTRRRVDAGFTLPPPSWTIRP